MRLTIASDEEAGMSYCLASLWVVDASLMIQAKASTTLMRADAFGDPLRRPNGSSRCNEPEQGSLLPKLWPAGETMSANDI